MSSHRAAPVLGRSRFGCRLTLWKALGKELKGRPVLGPQLDLEGAPDGLPFQRLLPARAQATQIGAAARPLAARVELDASLRRAHQPDQLPLGVRLAAGDAGALRGMLGSRPLLLTAGHST